jgi:hypothetical protein
MHLRAVIIIQQAACQGTQPNTTKSSHLSASKERVANNRADVIYCLVCIPHRPFDNP